MFKLSPEYFNLMYLWFLVVLLFLTYEAIYTSLSKNTKTLHGFIVVGLFIVVSLLFLTFTENKPVMAQTYSDNNMVTILEDKEKDFNQGNYTYKELETYIKSLEHEYIKVPYNKTIREYTSELVVKVYPRDNPLYQELIMNN